jgi:S1-C subfamily serine protease
MKFRLIILAAFILVLCFWRSLESRRVADIFTKVNGSVTEVVAVHKAYSVTGGLQQTMSLGSAGSGVLVSQSGKVITSAHPVNTADQIKVTLLSGETVGARVAASAPFADISLPFHSGLSRARTKFVQIRRVASRKKTFSSTFIVFSSFRLPF